MANAKATFENFVENQNQLTETLTGNFQEMTENLKVDETLTTEGQTIWKDYMEKSRVLMEETFKPETLEKGWEKMPEHYNKAMEVQMDFYNQTMDFYKRLFDKYGVKTQQDVVKQFTNIYQKNMEAIMKAANANMKVFQTYFEK
jgi:hypothetical protein